MVASLNLKDSARPKWVHDFVHLHGLNPKQLDRLTKEATFARTPVNNKVFEPGQPCRHYVLVWHGSVRVGLIDPDGNEVVLYRLKDGDSCILTTAALLAESNYVALAVAETLVEAILIPQDTFRALIDESTAFRNAVLADHGSRVMRLMARIGRLAFESIDYRLAQSLTERANDSNEIRATHQALAVEVGTAREVVSRRLKYFEKMGWVQLSRGCVVLVKGLPTSLLQKGRGH